MLAMETFEQHQPSFCQLSSFRAAAFAQVMRFELFYLLDCCLMQSLQLQVAHTTFKTEALESYKWNYVDHYICSRGEEEYGLLTSLKVGVRPAHLAQGRSSACSPRSR